MQKTVTTKTTLERERDRFFKKRMKEFVFKNKDNFKLFKLLLFTIVFVLMIKTVKQLH